VARRALITGITGQDGPYLAEHLASQGYVVFGMYCGQHNPKVPDIAKELPDLRLIEGNLLDQSSLIAALDQSQPDEIYNLAAVSFVPLSWKQPTLTAEVTGLGVLRMLEAIRLVGGLSSSSSGAESPRYFQASSSEMFGQSNSSSQNENTPLRPRSPYGAAKAYAHHVTINYREAYGLYAATGILFNHESPRRGAQFVTRRISTGVARIKLGLADVLTLGNLEAVRDWGYAGDYVRAARLILAEATPGDYVIGTGKSHSVRDLCKIAFSSVGLNWQDWVRVDHTLIRTSEVDSLCADASKAAERLGWRSATELEDLIQEMVEYDIARLK
jgi:GDPmannose 4,6-dehydratase